MALPSILTLARAIRGAICIAAVALLWTAVHKATDASTFASILQKQGLIRKDTASEVAWLVIAAESAVAILALMLVTDKRRDWVAPLLLAGIATVFTLYLSLLQLRPPPIPVSCGCGWSSRPVESWGLYALLDLVLALAFLIASYVLYHQRQSRPLRLASTATAVSGI